MRKWPEWVSLLLEDKQGGGGLCNFSKDDFDQLAPGFRDCLGTFIS